MYENNNENISVVDRWHCSTLRNNKLKSFSYVVEIKKKLVFMNIGVSNFHLNRVVSPTILKVYDQNVTHNKP